MTTSQNQLPDPPEWMKNLPVDGMPDLSPRDHIYCLELDFDVDSQLEAIHGLLRRNKQAESERNQEIKRSDERARELTGLLNEYAVDQHISLLHESVYQDAAHSMAAVGMLAPFIETLFFQCFRGIGRRFFPASGSTGTHDRWAATHALQWDCHNVISNGRARTDLVRGIVQLADAINLKQRLPADIESTLSALFGYRNKMFHCGFEWPVEERTAFQRRIDEGKWPTTWFASARTGGEPWVFYLSDEFIEHCLSTADQVLTAFGEFVRDELLPAGRQDETKENTTDTDSE